MDKGRGVGVEKDYKNDKLPVLPRVSDPSIGHKAHVVAEIEGQLGTNLQQLLTRIRQAFQFVCQLFSPSSNLWLFLNQLFTNPWPLRTGDPELREQRRFDPFHQT
jgi:hypothetical protein